MLNYKYLSNDNINQIINKAKQCIKESTIAKSLVVKPWIFDDNKPITLDAMICLIMYCDYSSLSRDFTLSFRKRNEFELISN